MRVSKERINELQGVVRQQLVINPNATIMEIQKALELVYCRTFDKNFVARLKNKIHRERSARIHKTVLYELSLLEDVCNELCYRLWIIIDNEETTDRDVIVASRAVLSIKLGLIDAKMTAGVYDKKSDTQKEHELTEEEKNKLKNAIDFALAPRIISSYSVVKPDVRNAV